MTIFLFAPDGKIPLPLKGVARLVAHPVPRAPVLGKGVHLVRSERSWGTTDFYCTTGQMSASLERRAARMSARLIFLPEDDTWALTRALNGREAQGLDSRVRLASTSDYDTMPQLQPPPSLPLFPLKGLQRVKAVDVP